MRIFDCAGVHVPNPPQVQGSAVFAYNLRTCSIYLKSCYLPYLIQWKCYVNCCQHTVNSNFAFWNFLDFSFSKIFLISCWLTRRCRGLPVICLPYSQRWDRPMKNGVWPLGWAGTFLLKGHRTRVCLCPETGRLNCLLNCTKGQVPSAVATLAPATHQTALFEGPQTSHSVIFSQKHVFIKITGAERWMLRGFHFLCSERLLSGSPELICTRSLPFGSRDEAHTSQPFPLWWAVAWMRR